MTKWQLDREGGPWDYPTLGFTAVDGAIIDGSLSNPVMTDPPDAFWDVYGGGLAETGVTRWGALVHPPAPAEPTTGSVLVYDAETNASSWVEGVDAFAPETSLGAALSATYAAKAARFADLPAGSAWGHRGCGANLAPEHTTAAYLAGIDLGVPVIETDLRTTVDGRDICIHDATLDRTTDRKGTILDASAVGLRAAKVTASSFLGGGWTDQPIPGFLDTLGNFANRTLFAHQLSGDTAVQSAQAHRVCAAIVAHGAQDTTVIQYDNTTVGPIIASYGLTSLWLIGDGTGVTSADAVTQGAAYVGVGPHGSVANLAAICTDMHSAGIQVVAYTVNTQADYDAVIAAGVDHVFSDDPLYASRDYDKYRSAGTTWHIDGGYGHGILGYGGHLTAQTPTDRGSIVGASNGYRLKVVSASPILLGQMCPIVNAASSYTIELDFVYDTLGTADTQWNGIYFGKAADLTTYASTDVAQSNLAVCRANGQLVVYVDGVAKGTLTTAHLNRPVLSAGLAANTAITSLPVTALAFAVKAGNRFVLPTGQIAVCSADVAAAGTAIPVTSITPSAAIATSTALLQAVRLNMAVTPTTLTLTRQDELSAGSVVVADSTRRGAYAYFRSTLSPFTTSGSIIRATVV